MQTTPRDTPAPKPAAEIDTLPGHSAEDPVVAPRHKIGGVGLLLRDLLFSAVASILIITFLYQPVRVEGTVCCPGSRIATAFSSISSSTASQLSNAAMWWSFHYPRDPEKSYIKRVIGLPGDRLRIDHGVVWLNGRRQIERYVLIFTRTAGRWRISSSLRRATM